MQKDALNNNRFNFLKKVNQKLLKNQIHQENKEERLNQVEQKKLAAVAPSNVVTPKETQEILLGNLSPRLMSLYFEMKEEQMKVPQSFRVTTKFHHLSLKNSGPEKQFFYKCSMQLGYNFTNDLGILKKFMKK